MYGTNHSRIILYAITGCIVGLFAVVIIPDVGTLVYLVPPRNAHAGPIWYRLSAPSGTQNAIALLPAQAGAQATLMDRAAAACSHAYSRHVPADRVWSATRFGGDADGGEGPGPEANRRGVAVADTRLGDAGHSERRPSDIVCRAGNPTRRNGGRRRCRERRSMAP